ncbi:MAG TPA: serine/threonine-protein kinase [Planctomycetota bacterium]|nr:serine/threonine-protein kinase [Planctomycetota bacterium]
MVEPRDRQLLNLGVARGLLDHSVAERLYREALLQDRRASDLLVEHGLLSRTVVDGLLTNLARNDVPHSVGGHRILRQIGRGGMATVYLAEQSGSGHQVAIKLMYLAIAAHSDAVSRFLREANILATITHPHVVGVYSSGREGVQPYLVLELIAGGDASQLAHANGGALNESRAMHLIADACAGLSALHTARLLHRDIKPSNLLITAEGRAKLGDFGLARTQDDSDRLTTTGLTVGTPTYMSPEQAAGDRTLDVRSDIYSLGATLFALTTGQPPYPGKNPVTIAAKVLSEAFPDPGLVRGSLSPAVCGIIRRATARRPSDRFATPEVMRTTLLAAAGEQP